MKEYITKDRAKQFVCGHCNEVCSEEPCEPSDCDWMAFIDKEPAADVDPVRHGRCDVCSGKAVLTQDCYNGYSIEIDAEQQELSIWQGDKCLAYFHIDYCPSCGARMA